MNKFEGVIFDLDGTLLDTLEDIAESVNTVLDIYGYPNPSLEEYKYYIGEGIEQLVVAAFPKTITDPDFIKQAILDVRAEYKKRWDKKTKVYEGINELLDFLTKNEYQIAILSNKPHDLTQKSYSKFFKNQNFIEVLGDSPGIQKKPDPEGANLIAKKMTLPPKKIMFLGDTCIDMQTANNAGMFAIGVLWGFRYEKELNENGARLIIKKPKELINWLKAQQ
jgi:phosphoglycolate phosphatase